VKFATTVAMTTALALAPFLCGCHSGKRATVIYVSSYHAGYPSSDDVTAGIKETLSGSGVRLATFYMDSKRHPEWVEARAAAALKLIDRTKPNVIIASDDNAVKYVVAPFFHDGPVPCVFCGVNWTCDQYGLPTDHVTGMLEVLPVRQTVQTLRQYYPDMKRLVVLSENTASEHKNKDVLIPVFAELGLTAEYVLVDTYEQWQERFVAANREADVIFLPTHGAIKGWREREAKAFVAEHIRVPVFTCDDFMMVYAVFGLTKVAREQGRWAAATALKILKGQRPAHLPVTRNQQTRAYMNANLAEKIGFKPNGALRSRCHRIE